MTYATRTDGETGLRIRDLASGEERWLAFVSWNDGTGGGVHRIRADGGGGVQAVSTAPGYYRETLWSRDGQRILTIRGSARDVQENMGGFGGGLGTEIVWLPAAGGAATLVAPQDGRFALHLVEAHPDRIFASHGQRGLVSFRWDGTDEKQHLVVRGERNANATGGQGQVARPILMAPRGDKALAKAGMDLYVVTVPQVGGEVPTVNVQSPAFPVTRLTDDTGGEFPAWETNGRRIRWSLGNAHFTYDLDRKEAVDDSLEAVREARADSAAADTTRADTARADSARAGGQEEKKDEGYKPEEHRVRVEYTRDVPRGVIVLRGGRAVTMRGREIIENADVVVRDDRIEAVGPRGSVTIPEGAEIRDVSGKTILPGYVDTHYHTQWLITDTHSSQVWQYLTNLAFGVTTTQDVQTATTDILTYHDMVEAGMMLGPRIYHTGPGVFSGENVASLDEARKVLKRYKDYYGVTTFKMYMAGDRQQRQWIIMAARELGLMPTTEGGIDFKLELTHTMDGYPGLEHSLPVAPLFGDVVRLYTTTQTTYTPTLIVSYGGPWGENYFYTRTDIFSDARLGRFTPYQELEAKGSRRTRAAGWFRDEEHVFYKHAAFLKDLVEAAKANPKKVKISTTGIQSDEAFAILQLQKMTGAQFAMVHFAQGIAPSVIALMGGKVDAFCGNVGDLLAQFKSGEVRILGIMDDQQSAFYPGVKTFAEQGYKLYNAASRGFAAPAGTPKEVVDILSRAIGKVVATEDHKKRMADMGLTLRYMDAAQYAKYWSECEAVFQELLPLTKQ